MEHTGTSRPSAGLTDPNEIIRVARPALLRLAGEYIELTLQLHPAAGRARIPAPLLEEALLRLVITARDAMPLGGRLSIATTMLHLDDVSARLHGLAHGGSFVLLLVTDSSIGISTATRARRLAGSGDDAADLARVARLVGPVGGYVTVSGEPGLGSTLRLYLVRDEFARKGAARAEQVPSGTETLLLVERDPVVRAIVGQALRGLGYTVQSAMNAREALEFTDGALPAAALLVTDVVAPDADGPGLLRRLRRPAPGMRALYLTTRPGDATALRGVPSGTALLERPFTTAALAHRVREALDAR